MPDNLELARMGGKVPWTTGQLGTSAGLQRMGDMANQGLMNILSLLFYDGYNGAPLQGVPEHRDYFDITAGGDLDALVGYGWGIVFDAMSLDPDGDAWGYDSYQPVVLEADASITLGANDATYDRIDIVVVGPDTEQDETATVRVKNPTTGVRSSETEPTRERWTCNVQVVPGTPADPPVAPSVPAGTMKIAEALVPAVSGPAVWTDCRPLLQLGSILKGHPAEEYARNYIPNPGTSPDALKISASSPTSLTLVVTEGRAVIRGISRWYRGQTVTLAAADPTNGRIDLVCAREDGTVTVTTGTPAGSPVAPSAPSHSIVLAQVAVAALDTTIAAGDITDLRNTYLDEDGLPQPGKRRPIGSEQVEEYSLNHSKLSVAEVYVDIGAATFPTNASTAEMPISLFLPDGTTEYPGPFGQNLCEFEVRVFEIIPASTSVDCLAQNADFTTPDTIHTQDDTDPSLDQGAEHARDGVVYYMPAIGAPDDFNLEAAAGKTNFHLFWADAAIGGVLKVDFSTALMALWAPGTYDFLVVVRPLSRPGAARKRKFSITVS